MIYVRECFACVLLRNFIVSGLTFRSLIHFEFIFVYSVESVLFSFFYKWLTSFPSTTCYKDFLFFIVYSCFFCQDNVPIGVWAYHWAFCLVPLVDVSVFVPVPYCLDDSSSFSVDIYSSIRIINPCLMLLLLSSFSHV